jgi:outer membrane protein OmpA-like peptidoglycan-associated protein/tetratricopeptide (TPR) repeat protein
MKKIIQLLLCLVFLLGITGELFAQKNKNIVQNVQGLKELQEEYAQQWYRKNSTTPTADELFFHYTYKKALEKYMEEYEKAPDGEDNVRIKLQIAECHRKLNEHKETEIWFGKVATAYESQLQPIHKLHYADALSSNGKYETAKVWYEKYEKDPHNDKRGLRKTYGINNIELFYVDSALYQVQEINVNSEESDFSPAYYEGGLVFSSARRPPANKKETFNWNEKSFLDLYYADIEGGQNLSEPSEFHVSVNSRFHEGTLVVYKENTKMIFTRNDYHKNKIRRSKKDVHNLSLYIADRESAEDGSESSGWTNIKPFHFDSKEYSVGHPTITKDGTRMYFASDMPGGVGGVDLYYTNYDSTYDTWSQPVNLGKSINTEGNEMFPFLHEDSTLYFASNGHGGLGGLDIFYSRKEEDSFKTYKNIGYPINKSTDDFGIILAEDGRSGYFTSNRDTGTGDDDIYHFKSLGCRLVGVAVHAVTGEILNDFKVNIHEKVDSIPTAYAFSSDSVFEFTTKIRTAYVLEAAKKDFKNGKIDLSAIDEFNCDLYGVDTVKIPLMPFEPVITTPTDDGPPPLFVYTPDPNAKVVEVVNVFYDLDKFFIRRDASRDLDRVARTLLDNPSMIVALTSHTDSRASNFYNIRLGQRRSRSAYKYLIDKGISPKRLKVSSFGETVLVTNCPDGEDCDEVKHQENRRTEIIILDY